MYIELRNIFLLSYKVTILEMQGFVFDSDSFFYFYVSESLTAYMRLHCLKYNTSVKAKPMD